MECPHKHGDQVPALMGWVCGQCWKILPERPTKYGMHPPGYGAESRQFIKWRAEIRKSADGTTLAIFLKAMARRITHRSGLVGEDAYQAALEAARLLEVEFGHPDYDWSRLGAIDIADEEMTYWDEATGVANA